MALLWGYMTWLSSVQLVSIVQLSTVKRSELVGEQSVRGLLQFSCCEPLLLDGGSWGTGIFREPRVRGTSTTESHYQATTGEDTADWKDSVHVVVNYSVCELATALQLLVVTISKCSINPVTSQTLSTVAHKHDNILTKKLYRLHPVVYIVFNYLLQPSTQQIMWGYLQWRQ
jgi:hypothetical protein